MKSSRLLYGLGGGHGRRIDPRIPRGAHGAPLSTVATEPRSFVVNAPVGGERAVRTIAPVVKELRGVAKGLKVPRHGPLDEELRPDPARAGAGGGGSVEAEGVEESVRGRGGVLAAPGGGPVRGGGGGLRP